MDSYEAARAVYSRIQSVDPDNAHKIVAYILLQDQSEKEMIRLAFGPENLIHSIITKAKTEFGLSSNTSSATPHHSSASAPASSFVSISRPHLSLSSPRLAVHNPSSPSIWSASSFSNHLPVSPDANPSLSYASVVNGTKSTNTFFSDEYHHFQEHNLSFLDEPLSKNHNFPDQFPETAMSPGCRSDSLMYPCWENGISFDNGGRSRSSSVNDICFEQYKQQVMRSKVSQQQRLAAAQYMAGLNSPYTKLNSIQREAQRSAAAAALMTGDDVHKLNRLRIARNDSITEMGYGDSAPTFRQIYLTFPADCTFMEEDVSNYFSIYGPVQDVRIPYQPKRMFGFVTFLYPETVKIILAKGNPHFVCDSRVLVKPYKEKAKLIDKKQQFDRSEFLSCSSPSGLDREPFEMHVGPRMLHNNQEMLRKKLEQEVRWQQALEFQRRRLMDLQLLDLKNHHCYQNDASVGSPPHPVNNHETSLNQSSPPTANVFSDDALEENRGNPTASPTKQPQEDTPTTYYDGGNDNKKDDLEIKVPNVLESLSASPTKSAAVDQSIFSPKPVEVDSGVSVSTSTANNDLLTLPAASTRNMAPPKSCFLEIPRFSSEHGAIGM